MKKYLRHLLVIVVFCAGLGLLVAGANWLFSQTAAASNYDPLIRYRENAKRLHYQRYDYDGAIRQYDKIVELDPFDGHALYKRAECYRKIYFVHASAENDQYSAEEIDAAAQATIEAYEPLIEFPRFRSASQFYLACVHARQRDADVAFNYLDSSMSDGSKIPEGNGNLRESASARFYFEWYYNDRNISRSDPRYLKALRQSNQQWSQGFHDRGRGNSGQGILDKKPSIGN